MLKKKIKNLIDLIESTEIEEIEVSSFWGAQKIRLSKSNKNAKQSEATSIPKSQDKVITAENDAVDNKEEENTVNKEVQESVLEEIKEEPVLNLHEIKAPLVGTFYSSPKPSDPPFVNIGDKVNKGDTICIIEAMKIFNEIESDVNGIVKEVCVDNGSPVEFDQLIIKISAE